MMEVMGFTPSRRATASSSSDRSSTTMAGPRPRERTVTPCTSRATRRRRLRAARGRPWASRQDQAVVTDNYSGGGSYALRIGNWDTRVVRGNVAAGPNGLYLEASGLENYPWSANTYFADPSRPAWYFNTPLTWQQWKDA